MKRFSIIAFVLLCGIVPGSAQSVADEPQPDPVLDAIREFSERQEKPVPMDPSKSEEEALGSKKLSGEEKSSGRSIETVENSGQSVADEKKIDSPEGLVVRVERLQTAKGLVDPAQVKLLAPFPAKPLGAAPAGWKLEASDSAPPFSREVEISPGSRISLTIRPHLLVPEADGAHVFSVRETGYDHHLGYQQSATVGAILSNSVRQLDEDSKRLDSVIENLQQLLISLPKAEPPPPSEPAPRPEVTKPVPLRKR